MSGHETRAFCRLSWTRAWCRAEWSLDSGSTVCILIRPWVVWWSTLKKGFPLRRLDARCVLVKRLDLAMQPVRFPLAKGVIAQASRNAAIPRWDFKEVTYY